MQAGAWCWQWPHQVLSGCFSCLQNQRMCALHPNIVQLREVFLTADYLAVAMEYADGGDLSEHIDQQYQKGVSCADFGSVLEFKNCAPQSLDVLPRAAHDSR